MVEGMLSGRRPPHDYLGTVIGTPDPRGLARFYAEVLGWTIHSDEEDWATIAPERAHVYLGFQLERNHVEPKWPALEGEQQMQIHLDIEVSDPRQRSRPRCVSVGACRSTSRRRRCGSSSTPPDTPSASTSAPPRRPPRPRSDPLTGGRRGRGGADFALTTSACRVSRRCPGGSQTAGCTTRPGGGIGRRASLRC